MAMEVATLGIRVDSTGARQELDNLTSTTNRTTQAMTASERAAASMGTAMKTLAGALSGMGFAAFAKGILDTNREMESLRASLKSTMGTAEAASAAFNSISDFAKTTPFEIKGLTQTFVMLQNMGIKPTHQVMEALTNQASKLGGSQETLTSIAMQLGQAHSKGKLQMEDMTVLMERGVPVMKMLAEITGKNGEELADMSAKGTITNDIIDKLIIKMGEMSSGSNANAMETLNGKISSLSDAWHSFEDTLLNDKSEGLIKKVVSNWTDWLDYFRESIAGVGQEFKALDEINGKIVQSKAKIAALSQGGVSGAAWTAVGALTGDNLAGEENRLKDLVKQRDGVVKSTHDAVVAKNAEKAATDSLLNSTTAETKATTAGAESKKEHEKAVKAAAKAQKDLEKANADAMKTLEDNHAKLTLSERDYYAQSAALSKMTPAQKAFAMAQWDVNHALESQKKSGDTAKTEMDGLKDKYNQLTLSASAYYAKTLEKKGLSPEQSKPLIEQNDLNIKKEADNKKTEDARKSLEDYNKTLDDTKLKTQELGNISSAVFDGALGGINTIAGAFGTMVDAIGKNTDALTALHAKQVENDNFKPDMSKGMDEYNKQLKFKQDNVVKYAKEESKLNTDNVKSQLTGASQIAGAAASMFDKKSGAAKAFHAIEMALSVARLAMDAKEMASSLVKTTTNIAEGASKMFGQSGWLGFAGVAAMLAVMAGLGFAASGSGSSNQAPPESSPDSGSVLGDSTAKSESVSKTYQLLKDIHASEYVQLQGINQGVANLSNAITSTITNVFKSGGLDLSNKGINLSKPDNGIMGIVGGLFSGGYRDVVERGIATPSQKLSDVKDKEFQASQYNVVKTRTWDLFSDSTTYTTIMTSLDGKVKSSLKQVFSAMGDQMTSLAKVFGGNLQDKIDTYVIPAMKINLTGLNGEKAAAKMNNVISTAMDKMNAAVFGSIVGQFQKLGEGMYETTVRIVAEIALVSDAIGKTLTENLVYVSDALVQAAGGLAEYQKQVGDFRDKFYSEAANIERRSTQFAGLMTAVGSAIPGSREGFKNLVNAQNLNTESGRKLYSILMSLVNVADDYYSAQEKLAKSSESNLRNLAGLAPTVTSAIYNLNLQLIDARSMWALAGLSATEAASMTTKAFANLKTTLLQPFVDAKTSIATQIAGIGGVQVDAGDINSMMDALKKMTDPTEQINQYKKIQSAMTLRYNNEIAMINKVKSLVDYLNNEKLGTGSTLTPEQKLAEASKQFSETLAKAQTGDAASITALTGAATAYKNAGKDYFASGDEFNNIVNETDKGIQSVIDKFGSAADTVATANDQLTTGLQTLSDILDGFVTQLSGAFDSIAKSTQEKSVVAPIPMTQATTRDKLVEKGITDSQTFNTDKANASAKGDTLKTIARAAGYGDNYKAYTKDMKATVTDDQVKLKIDDLKLKNYDYWHNLGKEDKALKSIDDANTYLQLWQANQTEPTKAQRKTEKDLAKNLMDTASGTLHFLPDLKFRKAGGWTSGLTMVGEAGAELIDFRSPAYVHNNADTNRILSKGNDDKDNEKELIELRAIVRTLSAGMQAMIDQQSETNRTLSALERKARLEQAA